MTLHIGIGDRPIDKKTVILIVMMIIDSYQRLKDPYNIAHLGVGGFAAISSIYALLAKELILSNTLAPLL